MKAFMYVKFTSYLQLMIIDVKIRVGIEETKNQEHELEEETNRLSWWTISGYNNGINHFYFVE